MPPGVLQKLAPLIVVALGAAALADGPQPAAPPAAPAPAPAAAPVTPITDADRSFWSFQPPKATEPPASTADAAWPRTRVDRFIDARLQAKQVRPAPEAPRAVLVRRLSFDLTGLPPTPEEVDAFLLDNRPDAYERLVDRLLASPRFGERMASLWLPLARYAEDQAHQVGDDTKFFYPNAWRYRQWVIDAFNRDLPYDRFVAYQLAADKLDGAKPDDQAALGFLGLGPKYYDRSRTAIMADEWEDRVDTVTRTMLGLTVACARCHDHKFDPIPTADYYALAGVFASTKMVNRKPDGTVQDKELEAGKVDPGTVHVVAEGDAKDLHVFLRGSPERPGDLAPRHFLTILSKDKPEPFKDGSGRKELAERIASRDNPLTARVMVNRVWGMLFGTPIVATPSNFGRSGQPPTDQALLDDLAVRFEDKAWSVKWLVRELVTSAAYRQSAAVSPEAAKVDPANELLSRMNRRRLSIEQWRDSVLMVAGKLDLGGGKSLELSDPANLHRTIYARVSRLKLNDLLMQFDYPDANVHAEKRSGTNTATQKLFMLNSPFMLAQSKAFATRVAADAGESGEARVRRAFRLLYAREPDGDELKLAADFLGRPATQAGGMTRWEQYAQALLISNEAMYVD
jgi:hypothetical protein